MNPRNGIVFAFTPGFLLVLFIALGSSACAVHVGWSLGGRVVVALDTGMRWLTHDGW